MRHDADAVIVGGGPAGAAAAARLAAGGFTTILVDRSTFPRDKVCGDFVGPVALTELADLGVAGTEAFRATSKILEGALHVDGDQLTARPLPQVDGLPSYGRVIPRLQLDAWVLDAARQAGAAVLDGRKVTAVEQAPGAVTVRGSSAAGPWQLRTRLLLEADGSNSTVARAARKPAAQAGPDPGGAGLLRSCRRPGRPGRHLLLQRQLPRLSLAVPGQRRTGERRRRMLQSTYPHTGRNLRELLLRLIAGDTAMQHRLRGARMDGKVLACDEDRYRPPPSPPDP